LVGWLVGWLVGRFVSWLVGWLVGWMVGRSVGLSVVWSVDWLVGWFVRCILFEFRQLTGNFECEILQLFNRSTFVIKTRNFQVMCTSHSL
jgi:hypothetical protein